MAEGNIEIIEMDLRLIWVTVAVLVEVPAVWSILSSCVRHRNQWSGHLLSWCSETVLTNCVYKNVHSNPFAVKKENAGVSRADHLLQYIISDFNNVERQSVKHGYNPTQLRWLFRGVHIDERIVVRCYLGRDSVDQLDELIINSTVECIMFLRDPFVHITDCTLPETDRDS